MVYHRALLNPTDGQISDLMQGTEVKLGPSNTDGDVAFKLTTVQMKKIATAVASNKGCTLKFSAAQVKHMAVHGEGFISDMAAEAFKALKPALRSGLNKGVKFVRGKAQNKINDGLDYIEDKVQDKAESALRLKGDGFGSFMKKALRKGAHGLVDVAADAIGGHVMVGNRITKPARYRQPALMPITKGGAAKPKCVCEACGKVQKGAG